GQFLRPNPPVGIPLGRRDGPPTRRGQAVPGVAAALAGVQPQLPLARQPVPRRRGRVQERVRGDVERTRRGGDPETLPPSLRVWAARRRAGLLRPVAAVRGMGAADLAAAPAWGWWAGTTRAER